MKRIAGWTLVLLVGAVLTATPASAILKCPVDVDYVWVYATGTLVATVSGPDTPQVGWSLCNLQDDSSGASVSTDVCKTIYTHLVVAQTTETTVQFGWGDSVATTCAGIPGFDYDVTAPRLHYVRLNP